MMEILLAPLEVRADESRQSPGRLFGTLLTYETRARDRAEVFATGALSWPEDGIIVNIQHDRAQPIMRAIPEVRGAAVVLDAPLPDTSRGRDAAVMIRNGTMRGLSVEFRSLREDRIAGVRRITAARLGGAGLVDSPSYADSTVELRHRGVLVPGRVLGWL